LQALAQDRSHLRQLVSIRWQRLRETLRHHRQLLEHLHPARHLAQQRAWLQHQRQLLQALSPQHQLNRGFALVRNGKGELIRSIASIKRGEQLQIALSDGRFLASVKRLEAEPPPNGGER
ncbi:MAG: exodeoxyribonuclease VII large subunit, partial [Cyanobium sp.]